MERNEKLVSPVNILECFEEANKKISPLWDIRDYVAVNPFYGFKEHDFIDVAKYIRNVSGKDILPNKTYFKKKYSSGDITSYDLEVAIKLYQREGQDQGLVFTSNDMVNYLNGQGQKNSELKIRALSDLYDLENQTHVTDVITKEVSKWCAAYFDEGQAVWKIPTKGLRLYSWWKSLARFDQPLGSQGKSFSKLVKSLPHEPTHALKLLTDRMLEKNKITSNELVHYYYRLIYTTLGWSSYMNKFEFEAARSNDTSRLEEVGELIDLVVIRMAYDIVLLDDVAEVEIIAEDMKAEPQDDLTLKYLWLAAAESSYRRKTQERLKEISIGSELQRPDVQMGFCIDVRSEILRRHLENASPKIQTIGFGGFFGMPISIKGLGHEGADHSCPILVDTAHEIHECASKFESVLISKKKKHVADIYLKKSIQSSASSGFSFVETFGFGYIFKMLKAAIGKKKPNLDTVEMGVTQEERKRIELDTERLSREEKVSLGFNALKNMSLVKNFGKHVFFVGHGSESANNPYASALECGACAGHSGHLNARLLADILNEQEVRNGLQKRGIEIPSDTCFYWGLHNTAKDTLTFSEDFYQKSELAQYKEVFEKACMDCRRERARNLPLCENLDSGQLSEEFDSRANDWSEIRPEWGLSRNASFIVGRRDLTRSLDLEGRAFLHDYDHTLDLDLSVLEVIMTAPMIVSNWINMQYYASTVDPEKFGAGNKALNNVVGTIGCIEGNASDLLGGLTKQSVWYEDEYYHEPLRLQVFIEANPISIDSIIQKHKLLQDLIGNNWLSIISLDPNDGEFKLYHKGQWIKTKDDLLN